jgi:hypothetical protein
VNSKPLRSSDILCSRGLLRALHRTLPIPSSPLLLSDESHVEEMGQGCVGDLTRRAWTTSFASSF